MSLLSDSFEKRDYNYSPAMHSQRGCLYVREREGGGGIQVWIASPKTVEEENKTVTFSLTHYVHGKSRDLATCLQGRVISRNKALIAASA